MDQRRKERKQSGEEESKMEEKAVKLSFHSKKDHNIKSQHMKHHQTQELMKGKMKEKMSTMKGAPPPADLLVCFPSPGHLNLTPKSIYSPARSTESSKRHHHNHHLNRMNKNSGQASPQLWARTKLMSSEMAEPTSPKVTCAGQIKIRSKPKPNPASTKNWQSLMEEIERIHSNKKHKKKSNGVETLVGGLGLHKKKSNGVETRRNHKKDLTHIFTCFGSLHGSDSTSVIKEEDEEKQQNNIVDLKKSDHGATSAGASRDIFSKWFMVLQENKNNGLNKNNGMSNECHHNGDAEKGYCGASSSVPPSNALLLMRCRSSAPSRRLLEEKEQAAPNNLTLFVGGVRDPLSKSRRWT